MATMVLTEEMLARLDRDCDPAYLATIPCAGPTNRYGYLIGCWVHGESGTIPVSAGRCVHHRVHELLVGLGVRRHDLAD